LLRIDRIELREIALSLCEVFRTASRAVTRRRILLLHLHGDDGAEGWSECVAAEAAPPGAETIDSAWEVIRQRIAGQVLGRAFAGPEEIQPVLDRGLPGHEKAKAAVEMGAWELAARQRGVALAALLGGTRRRLPIGISIGLQANPRALAERALAGVGEGYRRIKLKIQPGADLDYVRAVRDALGWAAPLTVDANGTYTRDHRLRLAALDELGLLAIEQPLGQADLEGLAALQRTLVTAICLDESITGAGDAERAIALGSGRSVNVKPGRVGGFRQAIAIHDACRRAGVPLCCGGLLESGIGRAHNVALASLPNFRLPGDLSPSRRYWERDIVDPPWTMDGRGWGTVPFDRPGMGVTVDAERVAALTLRCEVLGGQARVSRTPRAHIP
jgi:O-succinylbenzoate synthase